jgi:DNA-binding SARP family transcriptional activator
VLEVRLLGPVEIGPLGTPLRLGEPATKLLAWLALQPNTLYARETIGEQLWPSDAQSSVRNNVNSAASSAVRALRDFGADEHLTAGGPRRSQLGLFRVDVDVARFRELRDAARLEDALELVRGLPLESLRSLTAGRWVEDTRTSLLDEVDDVLRSLALRHEAAGANETAERLHRRRLDYDDHNEDALRGVMRCLAARGHDRRALEFLRAFQRRLPEVETETTELATTLERPESTSQIRLPAGHRYLPTHTFPGTNRPDPDFNAWLMRDLAASNVYIFRGVSAKYVPDRVRAQGRMLETLRVVMLDFESEEPLRLRALDVMNNMPDRGHSLDEEVGRLRRTLLGAIVGLFDCRRLCPIDVGLVPSTSVDRIELFDAAVYVSLYHGETSKGQVYPETSRYGRDSVAYQQHRLDCNRMLEVATRRLEFRSQQSDEDLVSLLPVDAGLLEDLRAENQERSQRLADELSSG